MSDTKMVDEHLRTVQRLVNVLAEENAALKRLDFSAATALVGVKKLALADMPAPHSVPIPSTALARRLITLAAENQVLLERAIMVQTMVVRIIARAAAPLPAETCYNGYGGAPNPRRAGALALSTRA
jgi:hypothetical protein